MADKHIDDILDDELAELAASIRALDADDLALVEPPDDVWDGIAAGLADEGGDDADALSPSARAITPVTTTPPVTSLDERRDRIEQQRPQRAPSSARTMLLVAAAAVVVVAGIAVFAATRSSGADTVATAELAYDPEAYDPLGENALASVRLVDDDGLFRIEFDEAQLPASELDDADLEIWLLQQDDSGSVVGLVPLGIVDDIERAYDVPPGVDLVEYRVVDISVEPRDGDPQHSGRTILRGELTA